MKPVSRNSDSKPCRSVTAVTWATWLVLRSVMFKAQRLPILARCGAFARLLAEPTYGAGFLLTLTICQNQFDRGAGV